VNVVERMRCLLFSMTIIERLLYVALLKIANDGKYCIGKVGKVRSTRLKIFHIYPAIIETNNIVSVCVRSHLFY
jgi:hypothetical protein